MAVYFVAHSLFPPRQQSHRTSFINRTLKRKCGHSNIETHVMWPLKCGLKWRLEAIERFGWFDSRKIRRNHSMILEFRNSEEFHSSINCHLLWNALMKCIVFGDQKCFWGDLQVSSHIHEKYLGQIYLQNWLPVYGNCLQMDRINLCKSLLGFLAWNLQNDEHSFIFTVKIRRFE